MAAKEKIDFLTWIGNNWSIFTTVILATIGTIITVKKYFFDKEETINNNNKKDIANIYTEIHRVENNLKSDFLINKEDINKILSSCQSRCDEINGNNLKQITDVYNNSYINEVKPLKIEISQLKEKVEFMTETFIEVSKDVRANTEAVLNSSITQIKLEKTNSEIAAKIPYLIDSLNSAIRKSDEAIEGVNKIKKSLSS